MQDPQLLGLVILLGGLVLANGLIHWVVICRALYRRGARFPTGFLFWRIFREQRVYRELCRARGKPVSGYHVALILTWFNLLLALAVALLALYDYTHGPQ